MDTKLKGDIGQLAITLALLRSEINVLVPVGDRLPYDLVAEYNGQFKRVQCKYAKTNAAGGAKIKIKNRDSSAIMYSKDNIDIIAIYNPETNITCFIHIDEISGDELCIRFTDAKYHRTNVKYGQYYKNPLRIFDMTIVDKYVPEKMPILNRKKKVNWPSKEQLKKMVWEMPVTTLAKMYNVSDNAVGKWCKKYGVTKPSRGYWTTKSRQ